MIKKTLHFSHAAYLSLRLGQLVVRLRKEQSESEVTLPIEDLGLIILDHPQITLSQRLINAFVEQNTAVVWCDEKHLPQAWIQPMNAHHTATEKLRYQIDASEPLKKQLWKQTVQSKIANQAALLSRIGKPTEKLHRFYARVGSGDSGNEEGRAAAYYWSQVFSDFGDFQRHREGKPPNHLLNYGYVILRSIMARALVGSGLHPALGIHHRNKYNAYCLADDLMEPYRPIADGVVIEIMQKHKGQVPETLDRETILPLLNLPALDVLIDKQTSPLFVAMQRTSASLSQCYEGLRRRLTLPTLIE